MPPVIRYDRNAVLSAAYNLARRDGISALNARAVAKEIGSSTQPIFRLYTGMDELKDDVHAMAEKQMTAFIDQRVQDSAYPLLELGLAYILFARDEPELFKMLFMCDRVSCGKCHTFPGENEYTIGELQGLTGYSPAKAKRMFQWLWIYSHGLAVGMATKYMYFDEDALRNMLSGAFHACQLKMDQYTDDMPAS